MIEVKGNNSGIGHILIPQRIRRNKRVHEMLQGEFEGTIASAGNPAWDGSSVAQCTEPLLNITSGPIGFTDVRKVTFAFTASQGTC